MTAMTVGLFLLLDYYNLEDVYPLYVWHILEKVPVFREKLIIKCSFTYFTSFKPVSTTFSLVIIDLT